LDVTCESMPFRSRRPGLPLSGKPRTRGSGIRLHARERRDTESGAWSTLDIRLVLVCSDKQGRVYRDRGPESHASEMYLVITNHSIVIVTASLSPSRHGNRLTPRAFSIRSSRSPKKANSIAHAASFALIVSQQARGCSSAAPRERRQVLARRGSHRGHAARAALLRTRQARQPRACALPHPHNSRTSWRQHTGSRFLRGQP
jgi:hypothetical protein